MCGIIGSFSPLGLAVPLQTERIRHRGPDSEGEWWSPDRSCWLGHTRLAIVDVSPTGQQPMTSACGRFTIVFNGEIYNHRLLREVGEYTSWRGSSDTETLLERWANSGVSSLDQLRGMFAFGIHDAKEGSLYLVRDRLGIKPLYFRKCDGSISFSSEIRALLSRNLQLDAEAIATYLAFGHLPTNGEIGDGVEILPPGYYLRVDRLGEITLNRWWLGIGATTRQELKGVSRAHALETTRRLVSNSVLEHMLSDVPVACFLSGGIDSSIISMVAARNRAEPLRTFSVGFPAEEFDERSIARIVAERAGSHHTEIEISPSECLRWVVDAVHALDIPSADALNTYIVSKAVSDQGIKVALSGLGGDELFGGYPSFRDALAFRWLGRIPRWMVKHGIKILPERLRAKLEDADPYDCYSCTLARRRWWSPTLMRDAGMRGAVRHPNPIHSTRDSFEMVSWAEISGYMEPMLLRDSDQMSMSVGLELRVPFLDNRLIEYVLSLPGEVKRGARPKQLLIDAFRDLLPTQVWNRKKQGFSLPMDEWMRGPLKEYCAEGVEASHWLLSRHFVEQVVDLFSRRQIHWTRLWQIVVLGHYATHSSKR